MKLPIPLDRPCPRRYSDMQEAGEARRWCDGCRKIVHDLSGLTEREAHEVVSEPDVCVRYLHDGAGRVQFKDRPLVRRALVVAALVAAPLVLEACGGAGRHTRPSWEMRPPEPDAGPDGDEAPASVRPTR